MWSISSSGSAEERLRLARLESNRLSLSWSKSGKGQLNYEAGDKYGEGGRVNGVWCCAKKGQEERSLQFEGGSCLFISSQPPDVARVDYQLVHTTLLHLEQPNPSTRCCPLPEGCRWSGWGRGIMELQVGVTSLKLHLLCKTYISLKCTNGLAWKAQSCLFTANSDSLLCFFSVLSYLLHSYNTVLANEIAYYWRDKFTEMLELDLRWAETWVGSTLLCHPSLPSRRMHQC